MKYTIRDLLWLTVVVALGVGWLLERGHTAQTVATLKTEAAAAAQQKFLAAMQVLHERIESLERERSATSQKDEQSAETLMPQIAKCVSWDDLALPRDDSFEPADLSRLATERRDKRINISGHMHAGVASAKKNKEFVLMRSRSGKFGPGHPIDELILVSVVPDRTVAYVDDWIQVEGTLRIEPRREDGDSIVCVYRLDDARISQWGQVIDEPSAKSKSGD